MPFIQPEINHSQKNPKSRCRIRYRTTFGGLVHSGHRQSINL